MSTNPATQFLDVVQGRLYYEVRGTGPLLLILGQPMTSEPFAPLADLLAEDHTVVTYDPHGLGLSTTEDRTVAVTPEVQADDLARLVEAVGGQPADIFASSGGAVAGLAFAARHPDKVATLIAHEPPVTELLPDARQVRTAVDDIEAAYRADGSGAAWGAFVSLVMHSGEITEAGVTPASWPPPGAATDDPRATEPSPKQLADDELFFLRMLKPFTRYQPAVQTLRAGTPRIVVAIGSDSGPEVARRSAEALAHQLGQQAAVFPGDHGGFMADPAGFATTIRTLLGNPRHLGS